MSATLSLDPVLDGCPSAAASLDDELTRLVRLGSGRCLVCGGHAAAVPDGLACGSCGSVLGNPVEATWEQAVARRP